MLFVIFLRLLSNQATEILMARVFSFFGLALLLVVGASACSSHETWPQFRGVNGSARSESWQKLPEKLGPNTNVVWKVALPPGHSSPIVFGERIYLAGVRDERLVTLGVDRRNGDIVWEAEAPYDSLEKIHGVGSHAQATPVTDGERVISLFGSAGLLCYDTKGEPLWQQRMGPFNTDFGAGTSPIIVDDFVIVCQDHDTGSFIAAFDKRTGEQVWKTGRSEFRRSYCTPVITEDRGKKQIVVASTLRAVGYDLATGREVWTVRGLARAACASPGLAKDGTVYLASFAGGGEPGARISVPPFEEFEKIHDTDKNGTIEESEIDKKDPIGRRFSQVDADKTGRITREEYEFFRGLFDKSRNVLMAVKPGGEGDVTRTRVVWEFTRNVPLVASPVYAAGHVFTVKDGGIVMSLDASTGKLVKRKRIEASGSYYSSPVVGDGKLYLLNEDGQLSVINAEGEWRVLSTDDFGEPIYATPAIVDGKIYLRTMGHLYCFGLSG